MYHRAFSCLVTRKFCEAGQGEQTNSTTHFLAGSPRPTTQWRILINGNKVVQERLRIQIHRHCIALLEQAHRGLQDQGVWLAVSSVICTYAPSSLKRAKNFLTRYSGSI